MTLIDEPETETIASNPMTETVSTGPARELPLGAIRPSGWLLSQLRLQADGITGQIEEVWPDVGPESSWLGGSGEAWERGPYYLDGLVPLAHVLGDEALVAKAAKWIEWMLGSQREDGFFGPASNTDWWPRMVALKVLTQHADATGDDRVIPFLERYFEYQLRELPRRPLQSWGRARAADNALSVWWLHERTGDDRWLELIDLISSQTADWEKYLTERLITGKATAFDQFTHGPNVAMGLKTGAVDYLRDRDPAHRATTEASLAALDRWHGQVHGWFSGDEFLGGREATAGVETCQVVEMMFTTELHARIYGGGVYGDRLESLAFNLLAASSDPRMLAHQYHQQANQVQVSVGRRTWSYSSDDANIFGLEPHFGCCTANLHQGWPKFVRSLWMASADDGLTSIAWAPCTVDAVVRGANVRLVVETEYPFHETIAISVEVDEPTAFPIRLRIPAWCSSPEVTVGGDDIPMEIVDGYVVVERTWTEGDAIRLTLPMTPKLTRRERQAVGITVGPLVMVLKVGENWVPVAGAPGLGEWEIHPRRSWNYALVEPHEAVAGWVVERVPVGSVPFELSGAPVRITVEGGHVDGWVLDGVQAGPLPDSPVYNAPILEDLVLVPYGSARLRVAELPTMAVTRPDGPLDVDGRDA